MCQVCVGSIRQLTASESDVHDFGLTAMEQRIAAATVRRHKTRVSERAIQAAIREFRRLYRRDAARVIDLLRGVKLPYQQNRVSEAVTSVDDLWRLLLNGVDYSPYEANLLELYRDIMPGAMASILTQAGRGVGIAGADLMRFPQAQSWLKSHAIEFSKTWAPTVTGTVNDAIRSQLAQGWNAGEGIDQLIARIQSVYDVADRTRAEMIARTEGNRAYSRAQLEMGRELGAQTKFWIVSGSPYSLVDVCGENADRGNVDINSFFTDTEGMPIEGPPAHPNCLCDIGYEFAEDWELPEGVMEV